MLSKIYLMYYQELSSMLARNIKRTEKKFQVFYQRVLSILAKKYQISYACIAENRHV